MRRPAMCGPSHPGVPGQAASSSHLSEVLQDEDFALLTDSCVFPQPVPTHNIHIVLPLPFILPIVQLVVESELSAYIFVTVNYSS